MINLLTHGQQATRQHEGHEVNKRQAQGESWHPDTNPVLFSPSTLFAFPTAHPTSEASVYSYRAECGDTSFHELPTVRHF